MPFAVKQQEWLNNLTPHKVNEIAIVEPVCTEEENNYLNDLPEQITLDEIKEKASK